MITANKRLGLILLSVGFFLLIPFLAMQFTAEVNWTSSDFIVMGILLLSAGLGIELVWRTVKKMEYRIIAGLAVLAVFFLLWAELAVGVFGTAFAGS